MANDLSSEPLHNEFEETNDLIEEHGGLEEDGAALRSLFLDLDIARLGATSGVDRFADRDTWSSLTTGEPVFHGVRAWARCAVISRMDAGASTVIAAQAVQGSITRDASADDGDEAGALVYHNRQWHRLGDHSRIG